MPKTELHNKNRIFALILSSHRLWGTILLPYILELESNKSYYRLTECLSPFPSGDTLATLAQEERESIDIINEYSDRNLFSLFSRDKSVKEFMLNVKTERIGAFIRPFIEKRIYKCFALARDEGIPVYFQKTKSSTLHKEDLLNISPGYAMPLFRFLRNEEQSTYNLGLDTGGKSVDLRKSSADIICNNPCLIREGHRILFVSDVEGSKLKPFLVKDHIQIPKKAEAKYYASFVLNAVNSYNRSIVQQN